MNNKNIYVLSLALIVVVVIWGCSHKQEHLKNEITNIEKQLFNDTTGIIMPQKAQKTIELYSKYIHNYPHDSLSAEYIFRAAQLCTAIGNFEEAIKFYDSLIISFPEIPKAAEAMFMKAFVFDNYLYRYDKARENYMLFIQKFPNHDLRRDAEKSIQFLGMSNAEILEILQADADKNNLEKNQQ